MDPRVRIARDLAVSLSSGPWTKGGMTRGAQAVLGHRAPKSLAKLVDQLIDRSITPYAPPPDRLAQLILAAPAFDRASGAARRQISDFSPLLSDAGFWPLAPFRRVRHPKLTTTTDLADWLDLSLAQLEWLADSRRQHGRADEPSLQNYAHNWVPKRTGPPRLIEAPKARLKAAQRLILREILNPVPAHDAAHGFVKGRSCLSAAQKHGGEKVVITVDLRDFFLTVPLRRVHGLFRCLGYPWPVARALTGLCSTSTPVAVLAGSKAGRAARDRYRTPHLPQGAPTSPALANLCSFRLDCRLEGLVDGFDARYTRYADDLAFSGDEELAGNLGPFLRGVAAIVQDEGFAPNIRKTRIMRRNGRQYVTGLVVNQHLNLPRDTYDALKAILHNCRRSGPAGQNRDGHPDFRAHLDGRITWVETVNRHRGFRLRRIFDAIEW